MKHATAFMCLLVLLVAGVADAEFIVIVPSTPSGTVFTPTQLYFMSPTGSDANNGLSPATAWATPNHAVHCGDVIIAATGIYPNFTISGTVTNCPSTTAGIDGQGGIYFATVLCSGAYVGACQNNSSWGPTTDNWAIEGWLCTSGSGTPCFQPNASASGTTQRHHFAIVNDIVATSAQAFGCNDAALNHNIPGNGCDYMAAVGLIAENGALDSICLGAIDMVGMSAFDSNAGTHVFIYNNYAWNNLSPSCVNVSDGEDYMFDTWDAHGYNATGIMANNIGYTAQRFGIQLFYQAFNADTAVVKIYNNTVYNDLVNTGSDFADGDINISAASTGLAGAPSMSPSTYNNIAQVTHATSNGNAIYALVIGGNLWANSTIGGTGKENIFKAARASCNASACDAGNNIAEFNANSLGTNIYTDPLFTNTADLINNQNGAPACGGYQNTTTCLGWDATTQTLRTPSIISDLRPNASQAVGKGFQLPSTTCAANADYPSWLKGVVYLHVTNGFVANATIYEQNDLATKPCGM